MHLLLIGGTRFVGRAMAQAALDAGHEVTLLHRTPTPDGILTGAEHLLADRNGDLSVLDGRSFDATIDVCAYFPRQVETLATALGSRGGHHVFVSTMSVYADADARGITEDAPLVDPQGAEVREVTGETYGGLKVACEQAAARAHGAGLAIVRPTYVVGPHDHTLRFPRWVARIAAGGEVLAPGPENSPVQVVDARDQGEWTVALATSGTPGVFNSIGTPLPFGFGDLLSHTMSAVAPAGTSLTWVDGGWLTEQRVDAGDLPLWSEGQDEWTLAASNQRALDAGLRPRPLTETARDTLAWLQVSGAAGGSVGLDGRRERELLAAWHARQRR
jgi:2'-hydroxyisoflavone reductase